MSILFAPMKIKNMELRNRFVRSATCDGCADTNGHVTDRQVKLFTELAQGGVGLIVVGITFVHKSGQILEVQNSIASDDCIAGFKRLTTVVQDRGAKIALQLFHAGRNRVEILRGKNIQAIAPSFIENDPYFPKKYRSMTEDEIWDVINAFGDGAKRAREAGFDAVQLHAAHGFLPSQFLSPYTNHRTDGWGGPLTNRLRFHREIYRNMRSKVGDDYPVLIKIGVQDGFPGGFEFSEGKIAAQLAAEWGFDSLEISQGLRSSSYEGTEFRTEINSLDREAYFRTWCGEVKKNVEVPVALVGGLKTFELMEEIVQNKEADFISLSRPLINNPRIINEWESGSRRRAGCISCNKCLEALRDGEGLSCKQQRVKES
jgi:2,4-dienoyl-CoA reductase-like NADH-dependent reductase (Old Yellow Enzyme family)